MNMAYSIALVIFSPTCFKGEPLELGHAFYKSYATPFLSTKRTVRALLETKIIISNIQIHTN